LGLTFLLSGFLANGFLEKLQTFAFLTKTARSPCAVSIDHSKLSPGCKFKNSAIPSGMVALRDFDFGRAIEVLDLSGIVGVSVAIYATEAIYFYLHVGRRANIRFFACLLVGRYIWQPKY
jgi:hypothetical protein